MKIATCARCNSPLPPDATRRLCAACMAAIKTGDPELVVTGPHRPRLPPPAPEDIQHLFPQLQITRLIGRGGMGAVYEARQLGLNRTVALKLLWAPAISEAGFEERFGREGEALAQLAHEHIVSIHDAGKSGPYFWLIMEYVDGPTLRHIIQDGVIEPQRALAIVMQMCAALEYAHRQGVVHRDIKPENILVTRDGRVKVADFGLAKMLGVRRDSGTLTGSYQAMGTPHYMAPEQMERPKEVDHRADIYSLGIVLYEVLTGELPIGRFELPSVKASVDDRLDGIVARTLEREPARRYQAVSEVGDAVKEVSTSMAVRPSPIRGLVLPRTMWAAGLAAAVVLLSLALWHWIPQDKDVHADRPRPTTSAAEHTERGRGLVSKPDTLAAAISEFESAYAISPSTPGLKDLMVPAIRARVEHLTVEGRYMDALAMAHHMESLYPGSAGPTLISAAQERAVEYYSKLIRISSPGEDEVVTTHHVELVGSVGEELDKEVLSVGESRITVVSNGFRLLVGQLPDGDHQIVMTVSLDGTEVPLVRRFRVDTEAPVLRVTAPVDGQSVACPVHFQGTATDAGTAKVQIESTVVQADAKGTWTADLELPQGPKEVLVTAFDDSGHRREVTLHLLVDCTPPIIDLGALPPVLVFGPNRRFVDAHASDQQGKVSAVWDGSPVDVGPTGLVKLSRERGDQAIERIVALEVRDIAQNLVRKDIPTRWDGTSPTLHLDAHPGFVLPKSHVTIGGAVDDASKCEVFVRSISLGSAGPFEVTDGHFSAEIATGDLMPSERPDLIVYIRDEANNVSADARLVFDVAKPCGACEPVDGKRGKCTRCHGNGTILGSCRAPGCDKGTIWTGCTKCSQTGKESCGACGGDGYYDPIACQKCENGRKQCDRCKGKHLYEDTCRACGGSGKNYSSGLPCDGCGGKKVGTYSCEKCGASGTIDCPDCDAGKVTIHCKECRYGRTDKPCADCQGRGAIPSKCSACDENGKVPRDCPQCDDGRCRACKGEGRALPSVKK